MRTELVYLSGLTERWGIIALRGICAMVFGALTLLAPGITLVVLTIWFAAFMALDGVLALVCGFDKIVHHRHGLALILEGLFGLAAATLVLAWPAVGIGGFVVLAAAWAILTGAALLWGAVLVPFPAGKVPLVAAAALSIALGLLLTSHPFALVICLGAYLLLSGMLMLSSALRLRSAELSGTYAGI